MATAGPNAFSTWDNSTVLGSKAWSNVYAAYSSDNVYATYQPTSSENSYLLRGTNPGISISSGVIQGITVQVECKASSSFEVSLYVYPVKNGTVLTGNSKSYTYIGTGETTYTFGGTSDLWGTSWSPSDINSNFGFAIMSEGGITPTVTSIDRVLVTVTYDPNTAPSFNSQPSTNYNSGFTRTGVNNTPVTVQFTPYDAEQNSANAISYQIRTSPGGGGTLVGSGSCTSGQQKQHSLAYNASGMADGTNYLYVRLSDGAGGNTDSNYVVVLRDDSAPTGLSVISYG